MAQRVLLYTRELPTRLAVQGAFDLAQITPVLTASPVDLLEKLKQDSWDIIVLDGDSSPVPLAKLLEVVGAQAGQAGSAVLALTQQAQPAAPAAVLVYSRPVARVSLLGAVNRMLMARGKKPILRTALPQPTHNQRRALRVPLLVPMAYRSPARHTAWAESEVLDISIGGVGVADIRGITPGEILEVRNLLTKEDAAFHVVWAAEDFEEISAGMKASTEALRFWLPT